MRLLDFDRPDCPLGFVVGEDVEVEPGGEPQDQVLEAEEPAGDEAGVFGGEGRTRSMNPLSSIRAAARPLIPAIHPVETGGRRAGTTPGWPGSGDVMAAGQVRGLRTGNGPKLARARTCAGNTPPPAVAPTCDTLAGPDGAQFVDLGIYASWWTNLRIKKC